MTDQTITIVELCRDLLQRAENGSLTGIAVAITTPELCTASMWSMEAATLSELLGSVALLNARLLNTMW